MTRTPDLLDLLGDRLWIEIELANGEWWSGDFTSDGPMTFTEQESSVTFGSDDCHGEAT